MSISGVKSLLIACNVLREQIESINNLKHDVIYLEQGLHRTPSILREELRKRIQSSTGYSMILLGYGLCSRAVIGLQANPDQILIIPKIDDCIGLSMGDRNRYYQEFATNPGTYYFTKGWIDAAEDPFKEYHKTLAKYGPEVAEWTAKESLKHYTRAVLINTTVEPDESSRNYVKKFARFFNLDYTEISGSPEYLMKLLHGPWDGDFVVVSGGQIVTEEMFRS